MLKRTLLAVALAATSAAAFAAPVTFELDPAHTNVVASWTHLGFSNPVMHFGEADGTLVYDADDVAASSVTVTLPVAAIDGHFDAFNEHLRSAELFDAAKYPEITFRSTGVRPTGEDRLAITGDLTIKGITREVVLDATLNGRGEHPMAKREAIGFDATTTVKRSDFGLGYAVPAVSDEVTLRITTEALVPEA
ncbi:hypothetical protein GCM10028862_08570 [Luteimonas pelagia]